MDSNLSDENPMVIPISSLISGPMNDPKWETVLDVEASHDGSNGVIFILTYSGAYVIKASSNPGEEFFASLIFESIGIESPFIRCVGHADLEWKRIKKAILRGSQMRESRGDHLGAVRVRQRLHGPLNRPQIMIQQIIVNSKPLEGYCNDTERLFMNPNISNIPENNIKDNLFILGKILAVDLFLNNSDRIPCNCWDNEGNGGNLLISSSSSYSSSSSSSFSSSLSSEPTLSLIPIDSGITSLRPLQNIVNFEKYVNKVRQFLTIVFSSQKQHESLGAFQEAATFIWNNTGHLIINNREADEQQQSSDGLVRIRAGFVQGMVDIVTRFTSTSLTSSNKSLKIKTLKELKSICQNSIELDWENVWYECTEKIDLNYLKSMLDIYQFFVIENSTSLFPIPTPSDLHDPPSLDYKVLKDIVSPQEAIISSNLKMKLPPSYLIHVNRHHDFGREHAIDQHIAINPKWSRFKSEGEEKKKITSASPEIQNMLAQNIAQSKELSLSELSANRKPMNVSLLNSLKKPERDDVSSSTSSSTMKDMLAQNIAQSKELSVSELSANRKPMNVSLLNSLKKPERDDVSSSTIKDMLAQNIAQSKELSVSELSANRKPMNVSLLSSLKKPEKDDVPSTSSNINMSMLSSVKLRKVPNKQEGPIIKSNSSLSSSTEDMKEHILASSTIEDYRLHADDFYQKYCLSDSSLQSMSSETDFHYLIDLIGSYHQTETEEEATKKKKKRILIAFDFDQTITDPNGSIRGGEKSREALKMLQSMNTNDCTTHSAMNQIEFVIVTATKPSVASVESICGSVRELGLGEYFQVQDTHLDQLRRRLISYPSVNTLSLPPPSSSPSSSLISNDVIDSVVQNYSQSTVFDHIIKDDEMKKQDDVVNKEKDEDEKEDEEDMKITIELLIGLLTTDKFNRAGIDLWRIDYNSLEFDHQKKKVSIRTKCLPNSINDYDRYEDYAATTHWNDLGALSSPCEVFALHQEASLNEIDECCHVCLYSILKRYVQRTQKLRAVSTDGSTTSPLLLELTPSSSMKRGTHFFSSQPMNKNNIINLIQSLCMFAQLSEKEIIAVIYGKVQIIKYDGVLLASSYGNVICSSYNKSQAIQWFIESKPQLSSTNGVWQLPPDRVIFIDDNPANVLTVFMSLAHSSSSSSTLPTTCLSSTLSSASCSDVPVASYTVDSIWFKPPRYGKPETVDPAVLFLMENITSRHQCTANSKLPIINPIDNPTYENDPISGVLLLQAASPPNANIGALVIDQVLDEIEQKKKQNKNDWNRSEEVVMVVLPEGFVREILDTSIHNHQLPRFGDPAPCVLQPYSDLALKRNIYIVCGTMMEPALCISSSSSSSSMFHTTSIVLGPDGCCIGGYRKRRIHNAECQVSGDEVLVFDVFNQHRISSSLSSSFSKASGLVGKFGVLICLDAEDNSLIEELKTKHDVDVIINPTHIPVPGIQAAMKSKQIAMSQWKVALSSVAKNFEFKCCPKSNTLFNDKTAGTGSYLNENNSFIKNTREKGMYLLRCDLPFPSGMGSSQAICPHHTETIASMNSEHLIVAIQHPSESKHAISSSCSIWSLFSKVPEKSYHRSLEEENIGARLRLSNIRVLPVTTRSKQMAVSKALEFQSTEESSYGLMDRGDAPPLPPSEWEVPTDVTHNRERLSLMSSIRTTDVSLSSPSFTAMKVPSIPSSSSSSSLTTSSSYGSVLKCVKIKSLRYIFPKSSPKGILLILIMTNEDDLSVSLLDIGRKEIIDHPSPLYSSFQSKIDLFIQDYRAIRSKNKSFDSCCDGGFLDVKNKLLLTCTKAEDTNQLCLYQNLITDHDSKVEIIRKDIIITPFGLPGALAIDPRSGGFAVSAKDSSIVCFWDFNHNCLPVPLSDLI